MTNCLVSSVASVLTAEEHLQIKLYHTCVISVIFMMFKLLFTAGESDCTGTHRRTRSAQENLPSMHCDNRLVLVVTQL